MKAIACYILMTFLVAGALTVEFPYTCTEEDRKAEMCSMDYMNLCGWNGPHIKCFAYPCARQGGNVCELCKDPNIERVTLGECTESGSATIDPPALPVVDPSLCTDEERKQLGCPKNINRVCGFYNEQVRCKVAPCAETFNNRCLACQNNMVARVEEGTCKKGPKKNN
jgi:hypothetical protein